MSFWFADCAAVKSGSEIRVIKRSYLARPVAKKAGIDVAATSLKSPCLLGDSFNDKPPFWIPSENTFSHSVSDSSGDTAS
jgi:hypothetical protein